MLLGPLVLLHHLSPQRKSKVMAMNLDESLELRRHYYALSILPQTLLKCFLDHYPFNPDKYL